MITASVAFPAKTGLAELFRSEEETFRHARATYTMRHEGGRLIAEIEAEDATALKATVSSICRVLSVYEKAASIR